MLTERDFTELYAQHLSETQPNIKWEIVNDLTLKASNDGKEYSTYLENAYKEYKMEPDSVNEIIKRFAASSLELINKTGKLNKDNIIATIKPIEYLDDLKRMAKEKGEVEAPFVIYERYNNELIVLYGENTETSIHYFSQEEFDQLEIPRDSLRNLALKNLNDLLPEIKTEETLGTYNVFAGGDFEASLILFKKMWTKDNFKVDGDIIVSIPTRDVLIVTGSNNPEGIKRINYTNKLLAEDGNYLISPLLFKWDGEKFEQWKQ